jgi:putative selenium metabolism protein SsnA
MASTLLKNCTLVDIAPVRIEKADLRIHQGKIVARRRSLRRKPAERVVDVEGKFVLPGWVCAHTHLYSTLVRGMPSLDPPPKNFLEILKKIWWRIDWAHDEETIYYSALVGAIEAALAGTTLLLDHHASPSFIKGSLKIIKRAIEDVGIRAVLCYEVTDRGGTPERDSGIEENVDFISAHRHHPQFRGLFGAHASFTLGNDSLRACAHLADELNTGLHIHAAEDLADVKHTREKYSQGIIERIDAYGGLNQKTVLAHGTHLSPREIKRIQEARAWVVHNPRSNMNNAVGYACPMRFGERLALGTDGISSNMFDEAKFAFFKWRDSKFSLSTALKTKGKRVSEGDLDVLSVLANNHRLASEIFGREFGDLRLGAEADLVILNYLPPTPVTKENFSGHLLFGLDASHVESVMISGRFIVKNRRIPHLDLPTIYARASDLARRLWNRAF